MLNGYAVKTIATLWQLASIEAESKWFSLLKYHRNFITNPQIDLDRAKKVSCSVSVVIPVLIMWTLNSYSFWYSYYERWNNNSRQLQTPFTLFMLRHSSYTLISLWLLWSGMPTYCPSALPVPIAKLHWWCKLSIIHPFCSVSIQFRRKLFDRKLVMKFIYIIEYTLGV